MEKIFTNVYENYKKTAITNNQFLFKNNSLYFSKFFSRRIKRISFCFIHIT